MRGINVYSPLSSNLTDGSYALIKDFRENTKQNLKNLILTSPGERIMIPNFGVGIRRKLFEQNSRIVKNDILVDITRQLSTYMPHVTIREFEIFDSINTQNNSLDDQTIQIYIEYVFDTGVENFVDVLTFNVSI